MVAIFCTCPALISVAISGAAANMSPARNDAGRLQPITRQRKKVPAPPINRWKTMNQAMLAGSGISQNINVR